jgi:hypothetical protein
MGIDYSGMMIVGTHYDNLPREILDDVENNFDDDIYLWMEEYGLDHASEWYDCGIEGMIIGKTIDDVNEENLDTWFKNLKETFKKVETILKVKPKLIGTQNIW